LIKIGCVSLTGIFAGTVLTGALGERIVNLVLSISGLGVQKVELVVNPLVQYILIPLLLLSLILFATVIVLRTTKSYNIISLINE